MGQARTGLVMSLKYGAYAVGGPLELVLLNRLRLADGCLHGAANRRVSCLYRLPAVAPYAGYRESFWRIIGRIWRPGTAIGLQSIGFAGLDAFSSHYVAGPMQVGASPYLELVLALALLLSPVKSKRWNACRCRFAHY